MEIIVNSEGICFLIRYALSDHMKILIKKQFY